MMAKQTTSDPNGRGHTNALLEDINEKFQIVLEATAPIPAMQEDVKNIQEDVKNINETLDAWKPDVKLIPAIFDEVGALRREVDTLKEALR